MPITPNVKQKEPICVVPWRSRALLAGSPGSFVGSCSIYLQSGERKPEFNHCSLEYPIEVIEKKIASMSSDWFLKEKNIKLKITTDSYNALKPGFLLRFC